VTLIRKWSKLTPEAITLELTAAVTTQPKQWNTIKISEIRTTIPSRAAGQRVHERSSAAKQRDVMPVRRPGGRGWYLVGGSGDAEDETVGEVGTGDLRLAPHCSGGWVVEWKA
jgi:hypothetical protein